jgi:hypothetical protein
LYTSIYARIIIKNKKLWKIIWLLK